MSSVLCATAIAALVSGCGTTGVVSRAGSVPKTAAGSQGSASTSAPTPGGGGDALQAEFVNVGQGDCCEMKIKDGTGYFFAVIDTGPRNASGAVVSELKKLGCSTVNVLVLSHPDSDHSGGATAVMENFKVLQVWDPGSGKNTATWNETVDMIKNNAIERLNPAAGYSATWGPASVDVLGPPPGAASVAGADVNDACLVMSVSVGRDGILFTGDAGVAEQKQMMGEAMPPIETYKVPHHGGKSCYYAPFLAKVSPETSIIEVGPNTYGHPSPQVVSALSAYGPVYQTEVNGTIDVSETGTKINVRPQTGASKELGPKVQ
ncbi:MAG TPA: MBL fold metallo-hydrolase [Candidatus Anoxymicrobiaceae bacterium]